MNATHRNHRTAMLVVAIGLALTATSVAAQQMDHSHHQMPPTRTEPAKPKPKPAVGRDDKTNAGTSASSGDHANMQQDPAVPPGTKQDADGMSGIDHGAMQHDAMQDMDHSATRPENASQGPQNDTKPMSDMDHGAMQGMDHGAMGHAGPAPTEPRQPIPPLTGADRAAAFPEIGGHDHGERIDAYFLINRLEAFNDEAGRTLKWEGQGWVGGDRHRLWLRSEGERTGAKTESADLQVLYGRSIAPWWDAVVGIRHDFKPGKSQNFLTFGIQGLAPQKFEVEATGFVGERGQTAARLEAEYDLLLTNRLILQPLIEVNFYGQNDSARKIGSGLSTFEAGLRLRYEITRRIAPYVGIVHERAYGGTADFRREEFERVDDTRLVVGFRTWF